MKRFSKKTVSVLLMTILILTATAGSAWAYFTDYEQLAGSAVIKLGHSTYIEEQTTEDSKTVGIQNTGEAAWQSVFHLHIHLIPRYKDDGQLIGWKPGKPGNDELMALAEEIKL